MKKLDYCDGEDGEDGEDDDDDNDDDNEDDFGRGTLSLCDLVEAIDPRIIILTTSSDQGWSCKFSFEKGSTRLRPQGSWNASNEETENAIWVSRAHLHFHHDYGGDNGDENAEYAPMNTGG